MAAIDIRRLVAPLSDEDPCGPDLEYADAGILALEDLATTIPERQIGSIVEPAREPDWGTVKAEALRLSGLTRDLRVAVRLALALLRTDAWDGFADGLQLVDLLLREHWEPLHPRLDPADDFDPTIRVSAVGLLADAGTTLRAIRLLPLVRARQLGRVTYRDVQLSRGDFQPRDGEERPTPELIAATFRTADLAEVASTQELISSTLDSARNIDATLSDHDAGRTIDPLINLLTEVLGVFQQHLVERPMESASAPAPASVSPGAVEVPGTAAAVAPLVAPGAISSQQDVIAALDRIIAYYAAHEPSSPLPVLLQRARRLVGKDFWTIINDLLPAGRSELETFRGPSDEEAE